MHRLDPLFCALMLLAVALRLPGIFTDFWLDEIWTLKITYRMESVLDVFTTVRHSNNHHLNTIFFYLLGDLQEWSLYRLHSLAAGCGSVALAWRICARRGRHEAALAGLLCATSYLLIHYSSEARGYAMLVFFALAACDLLLRFAAEPGWRSAGLFWVVVVLGFLSHLMFLHVLLGSVAWMSVVLLRHSVSARAAALRMLQLFALPALFLLWFYLFDIRNTKIGRGPELDAAAITLKALSYAVGGPPSGWLAWLAASACVGLFAGAVLWQARRGREEWIFFAVVIFASPLLVLGAMQPDVFFVRYFLLSTVFGLIALAGPLASAFAAGGVARAAVAVGVCTMLLGNAMLTARFYRDGRGHYLEAMRFIADDASDQPPTVASDHRFRNSNVIRFYNRFLPMGRKLIHVPQKSYPEWLLLHRIGDLGHVDQALADSLGHRYELARIFPCADLSGWNWLVYQKSRR